MSFDDANTLNKALDPYAVSDNNGNFKLSCQILGGGATLAFVIGGTTFNISSQDFLGPQITNSSLCASYIIGVSADADLFWSFGTGFLRNVAPASG
jgi:Eukaryotic aspartyl protease